MKTTLIILSTLFSLQTFASCQDAQGLTKFLKNPASPWYLTTYLSIGKSELACKELSLLRSDAQTAQVEKTISPKLESALNLMTFSSDTTKLNLDEKLEKIVSDSAELE